MNEPITPSRPRRWFQFSLRALLVLMLVVAAYFAGFATSEKLAEKAMREASDKAAVELERTAAELEQAKQAALRALSLNAGLPPVVRYQAPAPVRILPGFDPNSTYDGAVPEEVK